MTSHSKDVFRSLDDDIEEVIRRNQELKKRSQINESVLLQYERKYLSMDDVPKDSDGVDGIEGQFEKAERIVSARRSYRGRGGEFQSQQTGYEHQEMGDKKLLDAIKSLQELKKELKIDNSKPEKPSILHSRNSQSRTPKDFRVRFEDQSDSSSQNHILTTPEYKKLDFTSEGNSVPLQEELSQKEQVPEMKQFRGQLSPADALYVEVHRSRSPKQRALRLKMLKQSYHQKKCKENSKYYSQDSFEEEKPENTLSYQQPQIEYGKIQEASSIKIETQQLLENISNDTFDFKGGILENRPETFSTNTIEFKSQTLYESKPRYSKMSLLRQTDENFISQRDGTQPSFWTGLGRNSVNERWNDTNLTYSDNTSEYEQIIKTDTLKMTDKIYLAAPIEETDEKIQTERLMEIEQIQKRCRELESFLFKGTAFA